MRNQNYFIVLVLICISCNFSKTSEITNGEIIDRLEQGFWKYETIGTDKHNRKGFYEKGLKVGKWEYYQKDTSIKVNWKVFSDSINDIKFNYVDDWQVLKEDGTIFFGVDTSQQNNFCVLIKNNDFENLNAYLYFIYETIMESNPETLTRYSVQEVVFENGFKILNGTFYSTLNGANYISFVYYFKGKTGGVFDFTRKFKIEKNDVEIQHILFNDVVYSFFEKEHKNFYYNDFIKNSKFVNLDSLSLSK